VAYAVPVRYLALAVGFSLTLVAIAAASGATVSHSPTLGSKSYPPPGYGGRWPGFGSVAPKLVDAEGDPNSVVHGVHWTHWGRTVALGVGKSAEFAPHGGYLPGYYPVQLRAEDLGRCRRGGPIVYRHLARRDQLGPGKGWSAWSLWPDIEYPKPQLLC
jgi:hypothetical protein